MLFDCVNAARMYFNIYPDTRKDPGPTIFILETYSKECDTFNKYTTEIDHQMLKPFYVDYCRKT